MAELAPHQFQLKIEPPARVSAPRATTPGVAPGGAVYLDDPRERFWAQILGQAEAPSEEQIRQLEKDWCEKFEASLDARTRAAAASQSPPGGSDHSLFKVEELRYGSLIATVGVVLIEATRLYGDNYERFWDAVAALVRTSAAQALPGGHHQSALAISVTSSPGMRQAFVQAGASAGATTTSEADVKNIDGEQVKAAVGAMIAPIAGPFLAIFLPVLLAFLAALFLIDYVWEQRDHRRAAIEEVAKNQTIGWTALAVQQHKLIETLTKAVSDKGACCQPCCAPCCPPTKDDPRPKRRPSVDPCTAKAQRAVSAALAARGLNGPAAAPPTSTPVK